MSACQCRAEIEKKLEDAGHNTRIKRYYTIGGAGFGLPWPIETEQVEKGRGKKKAAALFASYCPFCGESAKVAGSEA